MINQGRQFAIPRRYFFAALVAAILLAAVVFGYFYLPKADIKVVPEKETQTVSQEFILSKNINEPDFVHHKIPARLIEASEEKTINVKRDEASKAVADFARGEVKLINKQNDEQRLLPKTHLRHEASDVFFLTDGPVVIPPKGETVVQVTAKEKGAVGNVATGKFIVDKLSAPLQKVIYGESSHNFNGGQVVESALSEQELEEKKSEALAILKEEVTGELTALSGGALINPALISYSEETVEATVSPESKAVNFDIHAKVKARAFVVDENDLLNLTLLALKSSQKEGQEFLSYDPKSFDIEIIRSDFERGEVVVKGSLTGSFASKIAPTVFSVGNLAGLSKSEAVEKLKQRAGVGEAEVVFSPFWVKSVPARLSAVEIKVDNGN